MNADSRELLFHLGRMGEKGVEGETQTCRPEPKLTEDSGAWH